MLARCLPLLGLAPELLVGEPALGRTARWLRAASPGRVRTRTAAPSAEGWTRRRSPDVFRVAQVHFDLWGRLLTVHGARPPAVMHWTYPLPLRLAGVPNIVTVHDLIPLLHPALTPIDGARMRRMLRRIVAAADHIVTVSEATRLEVIGTLGVEPGRVTTTWQAVDVTPEAGAAGRVLPAGLVPDGYWLHVGTVERRKNVGRLIEAWAAGDMAHPLVLAGPDGWGAAEALAGAARYLVAPGAPVPAGRPAVLRLPWVERGALLALMQGARAVLMPSLAEGFGLPVAEAMALGTPVLASGRGALAEVAGAAGMLVDPEETGSIVAGLRALDDGALRAGLRARGLVAAGRFSMEAYAARLRGVYGRFLPVAG